MAYKRKDSDSGGGEKRKKKLGNLGSRINVE
jgi:hypothetical protein